MAANTYHAIGLMSGSSLDGLDIACCSFVENDGQWSFKLLDSLCKTYPADFQQMLKGLPLLNAKELAKADTDLGLFFGNAVMDFVMDKELRNIDLVASHGHTVFHHPEKGFTTQLGAGAAIAATCGITVVNDLRSADIAHGGNGAPIVPIADKLLFHQHAICLNLGGIANLSVRIDNQLLAFDFCGANQLLNYLAAQLGLEYDNGGAEAAKGNINDALLKNLNAVAFHEAPFPKSLDNTFVQETYFAILNESDAPVNNKLRTVTEFIALQFHRHIKAVETHAGISLAGSSVLVTGGGAFNTFLIGRLQELGNLQMVIPSPDIIAFKEAIAMAFIGVLRLRNQPNVLASVTGANRDTVNGAVYFA